MSKNRVLPPKTNNERSAEIMANATGIGYPNCYKCAFVGNIDHPNYRTCNVHVALGIKAMRKTISAAVGEKSKQPVAPMIPIETPNGDTEIVPSIIALEFGINTGLAHWPYEFDPIYILFCMFYTKKEDVDNG